MTGKAVGGVIAAGLGAIVLCAGGLATVLGATASNVAPGSICAIPLGGAPPRIALPPGGWQPVGRYDVEQVGNAATIASVGAGKNMPIRGWVIAVATAIQESNLRNLRGGDRDSIGLFQQRPSQGWGTPAQLRDPVYAAGAFYDALIKVAGWQNLPLTEAAQNVQKSAYPDAYAKHEADALLLVSQVLGLTQPAGDASVCLSPGTLGWVIPVDGPIVSGFRTPERPTHDGIDIAAARGSVIRAASAGVITRVRCNASLHNRPYSCDVDGSPAVRGCGWYTEITHPGNLVTRYCHQLTRPTIRVGQQVSTGQPIGLVGSSGNSSGPHLHFEVHLHADRGSAGAIDPVGWMRDHDASIGTG